MSLLSLRRHFTDKKSCKQGSGHISKKQSVIGGKFGHNGYYVQKNGKKGKGKTCCSQMRLKAYTVIHKQGLPRHYEPMGSHLLPKAMKSFFALGAQGGLDTNRMNLQAMAYKLKTAMEKRNYRLRLNPSIGTVGGFFKFPTIGLANIKPIRNLKKYKEWPEIRTLAIVPSSMWAFPMETGTPQQNKQYKN